MSQENNITCPNCSHVFDANIQLHQQIEAGIEEKYNQKLAEKDSHYQEQERIFQQRLVQEKKSLSQQLETQQQAQVEALEHELTLKSKQLKEFNKAKADISRLQREQDEQKAMIEAESAQRFSKRLKTEKESLRKQVKKEMQAQASLQISALQTELNDRSLELNEFNHAKIEIERLKREKEAQKSVIEAESVQRFNQQLKQEQQLLRDKVTAEMRQEVSGQLTTLEAALNAKSQQLTKLNQTKADLLLLQREKEELRGQVVLEKEREFSEKLVEERLKIQRQVDENAQMKLKELQKQLEDQKNLALEMNRKAEQGSTQMQGEVQELAIEEWLAAQFPLDTIDEIKKGARGADCLQIVHTQTQQNCGTIYYESKRTKDFQAGWIEKFKNDIREKNATLGVLVTEAMPKEMLRMGLKEGIWVCSFDEFKGLSAVLRETVIKLSEATASQENKGDKMELLYHFLTSNEFKLQVEGIVEGFTQMQADLDKEKRSMGRIWKQREKQLQKVVLNTTHMYGSIKGIAGTAVASVALLDFD